MCLFPLVQLWKASHCLDGWLLLLLFSCPVVSDSVISWTSACQAALPEFASPSTRVCSNSCPASQWCHPTVSSSVAAFLLPSIFPSIGIFSSESALWINLPNYCRFSFSNSPSDEYSGLISFRMDWLDLLAVPRTLKSLLQHHSSKVSALWDSAFFMIQLSHPYMTAGKTTALTIWTFVGRVMSLLFNILSRFVVAFLPRGKHLLISCL